MAAHVRPRRLRRRHGRQDRSRGGGHGSEIPGVAAVAEPDITGNPQARAKIIVDPDVAGTTAEAVCEALKAGTPSIHPRAHHVDEGFLYIDPIELRMSEVPTVIARLQEIFQGARVPVEV